jgi:hypothetical protein
LTLGASRLRSVLIREGVRLADTYSRRCWFTFPTRTQVEQPIIWQMSRKFPEVTFDIRQASVQHEIGIMAVLLSGKEADVTGAIEFLRSKGVTVEPIEKSVVEG